MATHIDREKEFHNARFSDDTDRKNTVDRFYGFIASGFNRHRDLVFALAAGKDVLEYGCGTGGLSFALGKVARRVVGIDISEVAIAIAGQEAAAQELGNISYRVENAEQTTFASASFDLICGGGIIHHLDTEKSVRELRRLLKPGGHAVFVEPLGMNPVINAYRRRTPHLRSQDEHPLVRTDFEIMRRHFSVVEITRFGLVSPLLAAIFSRNRAPKAIQGPVDLFDSGLCRIPRLRDLAWFSIAHLH